MLAGDAFARDIVDEAAGGFRDEFHAGGGRGGGDEADGEQAVGFGEFGVAGGFVGGEVEDQEAVGAGCGGVGVEAVEAVDIDGVQVGEEDDGDLRGGADFFDGCEDAGDGGACGEGAAGGGLDGGPVGEGVGKRDAEFENVGAGFFEGGGELDGGFERGVAGGDVGDEAGLAGGAEGLEFLVDAVHG